MAGVGVESDSLCLDDPRSPPSGRKEPLFLTAGDTESFSNQVVSPTGKAHLGLSLSPEGESRVHLPVRTH